MTSARVERIHISVHANGFHENSLKRQRRSDFNQRLTSSSKLVQNLPQLPRGNRDRPPINGFRLLTIYRLTTKRPDHHMVVFADQGCRRTDRSQLTLMDQSISIRNSFHIVKNMGRKEKRTPFFLVIKKNIDDIPSSQRIKP